MKKTKIIAGIVVAAALTLTGCESAADVASRNASTAADNFEVLRRITVIGTWSDEPKPLFDIEGLCAINERDQDLVVTCKEGPDNFKKQFVGLRGNVTYVSMQLESIKVDTFKTRVIWRPETVIPNVDLATSMGTIG